MQGAIRHFQRTEIRRLYTLLGDDELLARFLAERDESAFEELVCRHGPMVRAVCRRVLGPTPDADDAFQATFLVLIRKARSIRRTKLLANWLCAVSYRTARQALRRRWRLGSREQNVDVLPEPVHMDELPQDWLPHFDAALQRLPSRYREAVVLCDLQGRSRAEAARILGLNEGTLSSRLGRARDLLRKRLRHHGFPLAIGSALAPAVVPESLTASTVAASLNLGAASVSAIVITEGVMTAMLASKLKTIAAGAAAILVGIVVGLQFTGPQPVAGNPPADPPAKVTAKEELPPAKSDAPAPPRKLPAEFDAFQGEWVVVATENEGRGNSAAGVGVDDHWKFVGDALTTGGEAKEDAAEAVTLDPRAKPATIDFSLTQFKSDGSGRLDRIPYQGIYRFIPDGQLVICYRRKEGNALRPTRFVTAVNSGATVLHLRRPEPPPRVEAVIPPPISIDLPPIPELGKERAVPATVPVPATPSPASDIDQLQGMWRLTKRNGEAENPSTPEAANEMLIEIVKDRILVGNGSHGRVRIDTSKEPKQITIEITAGQKAEFHRFIYKIEGDMLTMAGVTNSPKLVPIDFDVAPGSSVVVEAYERVKGPPPSPKPPASTPGLVPTVAPMDPRSSRNDLPIIPIAPPDDLRVPPPPEAKNVPTKPAERDLLKEIDQLREQIKQLEKLLKERK
jgi:RNA polymerase sigma factor (sigma-70 family)